jgi:hypothetical protein
MGLKKKRRTQSMAKSRKAKHFIWILSLKLGPIVSFILLLTLPGTMNIEIIKNSLIELMETIIVCWVSGFVFVWVWYWLGKFVIKYGSFL